MIINPAQNESAAGHAPLPEEWCGPAHLLAPPGSLHHPLRCERSSSPANTTGRSPLRRSLAAFTPADMVFVGLTAATAIAMWFSHN